MTKISIVKAMVFPVVTYRCESWTIKKTECWRNYAFGLWCWRRLLRVPLDSKEIQPVRPKGDQSWVFIGRDDVEAEAPILWPPDPKSWLIGEDPDAGKDWGQEKGVTEDEMVGWHHPLNGHEFKQVLGTGDGQTGRPGMLQFMGSQRVGHDWVTELNYYSSSIRATRKVSAKEEKISHNYGMDLYR